MPPVKINNVKLGKNVVISSFSNLRDSEIGNSVNLGQFSVIWNSSIGEGSTANMECHIQFATIGRFSRLSWNVTIGAATHTFKNVSSYFLKPIEPDDPVEVGNDVWFGSNTVVLPGVKIGNGSVIGAGAVVTADIPAYAIVAGVPARVIKFRFDPMTIKDLERIKWWQISKSVFVKNRNLFNSAPTQEGLKRIEELIQKNRQTYP